MLTHLIGMKQGQFDIYHLILTRDHILKVLGHQIGALKIYNSGLKVFIILEGYESARKAYVYVNESPNH